jgi:CheY-like chemotaxis protein
VASIVIIDDDLSMGVLVSRLRFDGHDVQRMPSAVVALEEIEKVIAADLVFLDIIMEYPSGLSQNGITAGPAGGMEVLREIRRRHRDLPVIAYSATQEGTIIDALPADSNLRFISKWGSPSLGDLVQTVNSLLGLPSESLSLRTFIVHGHNVATKLALKNYLQNTLNLPEPTILHEQPNVGRTLIEKFEDYALFSSIVFVLLTPDDLAAEDEDSDDQKRRARQNVIFEMGHFLGMLGRRSGRVLLLHQGPLEIPSDISGLVYIDISRGIEAAGEEIRREIKDATS